MQNETFSQVRLLFTVFLLIIFTGLLTAGEEETRKERSLDDLMNVEVISASLHEQKTTEAPSNIIVITKGMIERRGYQNLVEVCQDIPVLMLFYQTCYPLTIVFCQTNVVHQNLKQYEPGQTMK